MQLISTLKQKDMEKTDEVCGEPDAKKPKLDSPSIESQGGGHSPVAKKLSENTDAEVSKSVPSEEASMCPSTHASQEPKPIEEKVLKETDVGISEYISTHEGFSGIIKQRYVYLFYCISFLGMG